MRSLSRCASSAGRVLGLLLLLAGGSARPADLPPLTLEAAVSRALERHPALPVYDHRTRAQQGLELQSGLRPNLELYFELENFLGSGIFRDFNGADPALSLYWLFERGKRGYRLDAARAGVSLAEADARIGRLEVAADTALAFLDVLVDQERMFQALAAVSLGERSVAVVRERVAAGRSPRADLLRAEADLARARLYREDVEHQLRVSMRFLAASWGAGRADFPGVVGDIGHLPEPGSFDLLLDALDRAPAMRRYLTEQRVREAQLRLAEARAKPDWRFSLGARHIGLTDDNALVATATLPLAFRNRNQGQIAEMQARVSMVGAEQVAARVQSEAMLYGLHQELQHNVHRATMLREDVLPRIEQVQLETERGHTAGRYAYRELRLARQELLQTRADLLQESFQAHRNVIEIERLTGTALPGAQDDEVDKEDNGQ